MCLYQFILGFLRFFIKPSVYLCPYKMYICTYTRKANALRKFSLSLCIHIYICSSFHANKKKTKCKNALGNLSVSRYGLNHSDLKTIRTRSLKLNQMKRYIGQMGWQSSVESKKKKERKTFQMKIAEIKFEEKENKIRNRFLRFNMCAP